MSRQYLFVLMGKLESSALRLEREKPHGKFAPWLFRFAVFDEGEGPDCGASTGGDRSLSLEESNKTIFSGRIKIDEAPSVFQTRWAALIKAAKSAPPCWNVDTQMIWERFLAFNRARGNASVPAGFLLGFMRRWRTSPGTATREVLPSEPEGTVAASARDLVAKIQAAPTSNRQFHAADLCRAIGKAAYDARILGIIARFGCPRFTVTLAVHGQAVMAGEISR